MSHTPPTKATRIDPRNAPIKSLRGERGVSRLLVGPYIGVETVDLHINELQPNSGPGPEHIHRRTDNIYWVLEGHIQVSMPDWDVRLGPDEILHIPPGLPHSTANVGDVVAKFIEIYSPGAKDFHILDSGLTNEG